MKKPNIIFVFADQWRYHSFGYTGNKNVRTPNIDKFSTQSCNFTDAISNCPMCSPYRASLLTGLRPLSNGVFVNDAPIQPDIEGFGDYFKANGYKTAYIGKWHVDGHGREAFIPQERRLGFDYWKVCECNHSYLNSPYFEGDSPEKKYWDGYDAIAQTEDAISYMDSHKKSRSETGETDPFLLFLAWGPPHGTPPYHNDTPYDCYPEALEGLYQAQNLELRDNVPLEKMEKAKDLLTGYYTHCVALDECFGRLVSYLRESGLLDDSILVFTSDHGDMLGSQGLWKKQSPFEESVRVPLLIHLPSSYNIKPSTYEDAVIGPHDLLPTLMGLADIPIEKTLDGKDYSKYILGNENISDDADLIYLFQAAGQWARDRDGGPLNFTGREYRGVRTTEFTYVRDLNGPWLLFDNKNDPYQLENLVNQPEYADLQKKLDDRLWSLLSDIGDEFLHGDELVAKYNYNEDFAKKINPGNVKLTLSNWGY